jgi:hypothetical protein
MARMLTGTQGAIPSSHPSAHVIGMLRVSATMLIACRIVGVFEARAAPLRMDQSAVAGQSVSSKFSAAPTALGFLWKLNKHNDNRATLFKSQPRTEHTWGKDQGRTQL